MSKCVVTFLGNPHGVYYNGQVLRGTAVLTTIRPKTVSAIYIHVTGSSKVRWGEKQGWTKSDGSKEILYKTYTGETEHFSSKICVTGAGSAGQIELPAGTYSYNFEVQLPQTLPSSIVSRYGTVRYEVALNIDRPNKYSNDFRTQFTVIQTVDLNRDPLVKNLVYLTNKMNSCCDCFSSSFVEVIGNIPFSGYASGQKIPFAISIDNQTGRNCVNSRVELLKIVQCTSKVPEEKMRQETIKLGEKPLENVAPNSSKECDGSIEIPSTPPTSEKDHIIEVSYQLKVTVNVEGKEKNIELIFPIKIGTVPIQVGIRPTPLPPTAPPTARDDTNTPPTYTLEAPPSYEEAVGACEDQFNEGDKNCQQFVPKYPCFRGFPIPSAPTLPRGASLDDDM